MFAPLLLLGLLAAAYTKAGRAAPPLPEQRDSSLPTPHAAQPSSAAAPVRLAFAGDLALAMGVGLRLDAQDHPTGRGVAVDHAYPFEDVSDRIRAADLAIGNLECVVSLKGSPKGPYRAFRAPPKALSSIVDAGFDIVSIANNHAMDFGHEGLLDMRARLEQVGLPYVGVGTRSIALEEPLIREIRGLTIGLYGFYDVRTSLALTMVKNARPKVDVLIVFNHWGREDHTDPLPAQRTLGHALIDAGVDIVVGTHAHVLQPEEWYRGKLIFYGLGNFVFPGMSYDELHRIGAFLELDLDKRGLITRRAYRVRIDDTGAPRWLDREPWTPDALR